jgi:hypothetical protein
MAFAEDLTPMFDTTYGFAVSAVWKTIAISVIFEAEYYAAQGEDVDIESAKPAAICQSSTVVGVRHGDAITISGIAYTVSNVRPDGSGVTILALQEV